MRPTFCAVAVFLALTSGASFGGIGVASSPAALASNPSVASAQPGVPRPTLTPERIREGLRAGNIDPDSPNGKRITTFLAAHYDEIRAGHWRQNLTNLTFDADTRLQVLRLVSRPSERAGECGSMENLKSDPLEMARTLSPEDFDSAMTLVELVLRSGSGATEHYTLAQRVDADAILSPAIRAGMGQHAGPMTRAQFCRVMEAAVAEIGKLPLPQQRSATYEMFSLMRGMPTGTALVIANPQAYLDEVFDERQLPAGLRQRLPKDGSRPLPFKRMAFEGRWVSEIPGDSAVVREVYVNRRDNGVVAEMTEAVSVDFGSKSINFALMYGIENLRGHTVAEGAGDRLGNLPGAPMGPGGLPTVAGATFQFSSPEPGVEGYASTNQCEVGATLRASDIWPALTGKAIEMQCSTSRIGKGLPLTNRAVWLPDYGFALNLGWTLDDKAGKFVITNVVVD